MLIFARGGSPTPQDSPRPIELQAQPLPRLGLFVAWRACDEPRQAIGLKPLNWGRLLIGMTLCGALTSLFLIGGFGLALSGVD